MFVFIIFKCVCIPNLNALTFFYMSNINMIVKYDSCLKPNNFNKLGI